MDSSTLVSVIRSWTESRRTLLASALIATVGRRGEASAKARKKRKKAKKPKPNAFG